MKCTGRSSHRDKLMQALKTTSDYFLVFCLYVFLSWGRSFQIAVSSAPSTTRWSLWYWIPGTIGMLCLTMILPGMFRRTSVVIEKVVIFLTAVVCILWLASSPQRFGLSWVVVPYANFISTVAIRSAAGLTGIRLISVIATSYRKERM